MPCDVDIKAMPSLPITGAIFDSGKSFRRLGIGDAFNARDNFCAFGTVFEQDGKNALFIVLNETIIFYETRSSLVTVRATIFAARMRENDASLSLMKIELVAADVLRALILVISVC